jgi:hypothetical protein
MVQRFSLGFGAGFEGDLRIRWKRKLSASGCCTYDLLREHVEHGQPVASFTGVGQSTVWKSDVVEFPEQA